MLTLPMATARVMDFFSWNLMVDRSSLIFSCMSSPREIWVGNLPALDRPGPKILFKALRTGSEARKAS